MKADRPRILFVALANSTHTHAWVKLLDPSAFEVKLHGVLGSEVPSDIPGVPKPSRYARLLARIARRAFGEAVLDPESRALAKEIRQWRPQVIHTLGLDPTSYLFLELRRRLPDLPTAKWVVTVRGGPELALHRLIPAYAKRIAEVLAECDQLIADNELNYRYAVELGLRPDKVASLGRMPGVGGVDIAELRRRRSTPAARSRVILMPKAYECPASKVLPVLEALKLCWENIQPCEVHFTAATPEARLWFATLPGHIRERCTMHDRISRDALLDMMANARVMLAPSLTDGVPNVLYEAMALGCLPIVSPIDTLRDLVRDRVNVLFARNLYPAEIAEALTAAMSDDALVQRIVETNSVLVEELADRARIRARVSEYYKGLVGVRA